MAGDVNAKIRYTSFPVASPQQLCKKLARAKVRCVHYNDLLPTCCGLVGEPNSQQVGAPTILVCNKLATSPSTGKLRGNV